MTKTPTYEGLEQRIKDLKREVVERKQSEEMLCMSENRYSSLVESISHGIQEIDASGVITFANDSYCRLMGYEKGELLGKPIWDFIEFETASGKEELKEYLKLLVNNQPSNTPYFQRNRKKDGKVIDVQVDWNYNWNEQGLVTGFISILTDITERKQAEEALGASEEKYLKLFNTVPSAIIIYDAETNKLLDGNQAALELYGYSREEFLNLKYWRDISAEPEKSKETLPRVISGEVRKIPLRYQKKKDGTVIPIEASVGMFILNNRKVICGVSTDISKYLQAQEELEKANQELRNEIQTREQVEEALQRAKDELEERVAERTQELRKLSQAVEQSPVSVVVVNADGVIEYVNKKFLEVTGAEAERFIGTTRGVLSSRFASQETYDDIARTIRAGNTWRGEFHYDRRRRKTIWEDVSISPIRDGLGEITNFLIIKEDITERKKQEEQLLQQANYDEVTGLPNRLLAKDRLEQAMIRAKRLGRSAGLLFLDLDHFKDINDTMGHEAGDYLLKEAGKRIAGILRDGDTVARFGGDEFVVVLPDMETGQDVKTVADKILDIFGEPIVINDKQIFAPVSVGIAVYPVDGQDAHVLMQNADAAMYKAKAAGRNTCRFFTPEMNAEMKRRMHIESHLRMALANNELFLVYQPILKTKSEVVVGAEVLLRWSNSTLGEMPPDSFISLAEDTGLIVPIGEWVLASACLEVARWDSVGMNMRVAVNISARQFLDTSFPEFVAKMLASTGLAAERLELEITESVLMREHTDAITVLRRFHEMGVRLSIDDFGTGYSSLSYLKRFPITVLKIDRAFIRDVTVNSGDAAITAAIIAMAKNLKLEVVAEGVEDAGQLGFLRSHDCDLVQGFLYAKPRTSDDFLQFIKQWDGQFESNKRLEAF